MLTHTPSADQLHAQLRTEKRQRRQHSPHSSCGHAAAATRASVCMPSAQLFASASTVPVAAWRRRVRAGGASHCALHLPQPAATASIRVTQTISGQELGSCWKVHVAMSVQPYDIFTKRPQIKARRCWLRRYHSTWNGCALGVQRHMPSAGSHLRWPPTPSDCTSRAGSPTAS